MQLRPNFTIGSRFLQIFVWISENFAAISRSSRAGKGLGALWRAESSRRALLKEIFSSAGIDAGCCTNRQNALRNL